MKCHHCNKSFEFIARDKSVNECLTNKDIMRMIGIYLESPNQVMYCEHCKMETLQTRTAWKGTINNESDKLICNK